MSKESLANGSINFLPPVAGSGPAFGADNVMIVFQQTLLLMTNGFLQTQQQVMLAYLQSRSGMQMPRQSGALTQLLPPVIQEPVRIINKPTPAPLVVPIAAPQAAPFAQPLPELNAELLAGESQTAPTVEGDAHGFPVAGLPADDVEALIAAFVELVSQRTGYPSDMLDPKLDLESDLGIDSIKRVEILSSFRRLLPEATQARLEAGFEEVAAVRTLEGITDWIRKTSSDSPEQVSQDAKKSQS